MCASLLPLPQESVDRLVGVGRDADCLAQSQTGLTTDASYVLGIRRPNDFLYGSKLIAGGESKPLRHGVILP